MVYNLLRISFHVWLSLGSETTAASGGIKGAA